MPGRLLAGAAAAALLLVALDTAPAAGAPPDCVKSSQAPEIYGPTDINAQTGNQGLSVALNHTGTVTVLRWPRPSFYDQVKYHTTDRALPRFGARPNEGSFLGLAVTTPAGRRVTWFRDWAMTQRHEDGYSDVIVTEHREDALGLSVTVTDVVAATDDVLARRLVVTRDAGSPVTAASLVAFENFNLVVNKHPQLPTQDWCQEEQNVDVAAYDASLDAVLHTKTGIDESVPAPSQVAVALALAGPSGGHQVGGDAYEPTAAADGRLPGPTQDAYDDAADGVLSGGAAYTGQTTGALTAPLDLSAGRASAVVLVAAAPDRAGVAALLSRARARPFETLVAEKEAWLAGVLARAPMPATDDPAVLALSRRALVTLVTNYDPDTATIVASIATQSPYGEDWPRDGAFFNHALDVVGLGDWVAAHNRFYVGVQQRADHPRPDAPLVPPGNWAMNYYADGVVGGPIPWEIDETAYAVWTFWDHYRAGGDAAALRAAYPALRLAADFLVTCRDPATGLQCVAHEDDNPVPSQTVIGAGPVWLALDSAVRAAEALGEAADAARWTARRDDLGAAIEAHFWDGRSYGGGDPVVAWPVCLLPYDDPRMRTHLEAVWQRIAPTFDAPHGDRTSGAYETKGLIGLAKAWRADPERLGRVRRGLAWVAREWATPGTHVMGEVWKVEGGVVVGAVSQPHAWEQVLYYLGALEAYPPAGTEAVVGCAGVLGALQARAGRAGDATDGSTGGSPLVPRLPATGGAPVDVAPAFLGAAVLALVARRRWLTSAGPRPARWRASAGVGQEPPPDST